MPHVVIIFTCSVLNVRYILPSEMMMVENAFNKFTHTGKLKEFDLIKGKIHIQMTVKETQ